MPRNNGSGPQGGGPGTGRGQGYCGTGIPFGNTQGRGRRGGTGVCSRAGNGMGQGRGFQPPLTPSEEAEVLKAREQTLEAELRDVKSRLNTFKTASAGKDFSGDDPVGDAATGQA